VGTGLAPTHLLLFHESFTNHVIDGGFHKGRGDDFALPVPPAVVGQNRSILADVGLE
jgi:hypothetical protein